MPALVIEPTTCEMGEPLRQLAEEVPPQYNYRRLSHLLSCRMAFPCFLSPLCLTPHLSMWFQPYTSILQSQPTNLFSIFFAKILVSESYSITDLTHASNTLCYLAEYSSSSVVVLFFSLTSCRYYQCSHHFLRSTLPVEHITKTAKLFHSYYTTIHFYCFCLSLFWQFPSFDSSEGSWTIEIYYGLDFSVPNIFYYHVPCKE